MAQHVYGYPAPQPTVAVTSTSTWTRALVRFVLTLGGAGMLIVGALLDWVKGAPGIELSWRAFIQTTFSTRTSTFLTTAGFVMVALGLIAVLGLAPRTGWLTRVAGALGIVAFVLFVIQLFRSGGYQALAPGVWLCFAGAIVALIGGYFGSRTVVVAGPPPPVVTTTEAP